ncbi:hypothetical protein AAT19DRAFT_16488 [Rhodotorula toruloides]|uniref:Uncharacterized protein n=1 Tax=Rhodotorula toruloides TaxID=5286 RepID=A0A2T0A3G9_RHOTO|nr:hypothetical protein AAT19DRAFT_16488 [Rhodotorula toruloides]
MPVVPTIHKRDRNKPRKDKAMLLNAGRLMERRENRELDELTAQIASLEKQLEEARAANASTAALSTTTGGAAVKQLQKEVSELKSRLSEAEAERDAATFAKESLERQASRPGGGGGGGGSKQLQRELEETTKRLKAVEAELDLARQEARRLREQQARSYAANGCKMDAAEKAEYEEAMERVNVRLQTLEEKLAEEEKRTEVERHIERAKQATRRAESAEDNLANARAHAQTAKSAQKEATALKKEKEQVEQRLMEIERTCADLQRALSETQDDLADEKVLVGRLPREAQQRLEQAEKRHREEEQRLNKQLANVTDRCALMCRTLQLKEADVATIFTRGDTPLGRDLRKHGLRGLWSAYRDAQDSVVFLKTQVSSLSAKIEDLQSQLDEQDHQSLPGSWPGTDDAAATKAEIDKLKSDLHAATLELANEKTRSTELRTQAAAESASLRERIARLEAQRPATPRSESAAPTASSTAQSRLVIERLTKTVEELNKQNAVLRNENRAAEAPLQTASTMSNIAQRDLMKPRKNQLEELQKEATVAKGGSGAIKELQKQIAELRAELAESQAQVGVAIAERDAARKGDYVPGLSAEESEKLQAQLASLKEEYEQKQAEFEEQLAEAEKRADEAEEAAAAAHEEAVNKAAATPAEADGELKKKADLAEQERARLAEQLSSTKLQLAQVEELKARESQRRARQLKHAEERAERARDELLSVWEAAERGGFTANGQNKFVQRAMELEKQCTTLQERVHTLEESGLEAKLKVANIIATRYHDLIQRLRLSDDEVSTILKDGVKWPVDKTEDGKLVNVLDLVARAASAPSSAASASPVASPAATKAVNGAKPDAELLKQNKDLRKKVTKLEEQLKTIESKHQNKLKQLEQALKVKSDEVDKLKAERQALQDEIAKQKHAAKMAAQEAKEKEEELESLSGRHRADLSSLQRIVSENSSQFAKLDQEREEAEASLARIADRFDKAKTEYETTTSQLLARISTLEAGSRTPDNARNNSKQDNDIAVLRCRFEDTIGQARMRTEELEKQVESKIAELEELEKDRDRYRDELAAAREALHKSEARVPRPASRGTSRTGSPAPGSPVAEKRTIKQQPEEDKPNGPARTRSETEELAWLQQQKLNVVEGLEKERARLESELSRQTQIAQDALVEAGKMREELTQLQNSKAAASGETESEKQRLEVELGAQAQLALEQARDLERQRDELANMARAISDLERERTRLREELATVVGSTERDKAQSNAAISHLQQRLASAGVPDSSSPTPLAASALPASPAMSAAPSVAAPLMSATPSLAGAPMAITGQVRLLVEHLRKTNSELNKEIATLRDENSLAAGHEAK